MAEPIKKAEYERLAAFRYALRQFLRFSEMAAQQAGITPRQHQTLLAVAGAPDDERITMGELAQRLQLRHNSTVELINRLEAQGLVARESGVNDRRLVYVSLTPQGHEILTALSTAHREELRRISPQLSELLRQLADEAEADHSDR